MATYKKILKVFLYFVSLFAVLIMVALIYFFIKKDQIAEELLLNLNNKINGEVIFKDIHLNPFIQFPNVSLVLSDFLLFENQDSSRNIFEDPIAEFDNVYVAFDVFDILDDEISIKRVLFTSGYLDITKYRNNVYNFEIALGNKKVKSENESKPKKEESKSSKTRKKVSKKRKALISKTLKLSLDKISLKNVHLEHNNQKNGKQSNLFFYHLIASLSIMPDSLRTSIYAKTEIKDLQISKDIEFGAFDLELNTSLSLGRNDSVLLIEPSQLFISRAEFNVEGIVDLKGKGFVDLKVGGADKKLGFLSLLLSDIGIENLKTGSLFFDGSLKGAFDDEIPELSIDFGVRDLSLKIPGSNDSINHLKICGDFVSGKKEDLSEALLKVDTLKATLPGGYIEGELKMQNLSVPNIYYRIELSANVAGFENLFQQNYIDSLSGKISLKDEFKGTLDKRIGWLDEKKGNLRLNFDSVSFVIPGIVDVSHLNGTITDKYDKFQIKKIKILTGNTDLLINGTVKNLSNLIFDEGKKITANLSIRSSLFDIPELFAFDSAVGGGLPYKVNNLDLSFNASATKKELLEFKYTPKIDFKIRKLNGSVDSLFNPLRLNNGRFLLADYKDKMLLNFKNFTLNSGKGTMLIDFRYLHDLNGADRLKINTKIKKLRLLDIFHEGFIDSSISLFSSPFYGDVTCKFYIQKGEKAGFKNFELIADNVSYGKAKKKIRIEDLKLKSSAFIFVENIRSKKFSELKGRFNLQAGKIKSKDYSFNDVVYSIDAEKGEFNIIPQNDSILGVKASGKFILSPFENPPSYSFDYSLHQFSAGRLFVNFLEDSVLTGKISFNIKLSFKGNEEKMILKTLSGKIKMQGRGLTLYGANVDDFLKEYRETQNFNLLDIGVVVYAGPIGILATKGTDFAHIKVTDRKKQSKIDRMISDWKIVGDSLKVEDVALRTGNNRIALKGWYRYASDSLDFNIGVLDKKGCSILNQGFSGASANPEMSNFDLLKFKVLDKEKEKKCKPFYKGKLEHPKIKAKDLSEN